MVYQKETVLVIITHIKDITLVESINDNYILG